MTGLRHAPGPSQRKAARKFLTSALGLLIASLIVTPAALAETATSPTGMVSVSVPPPVVAGAASTYTMTVTNTTSLPMTSLTAVGSMPSGMTLKNISGCARLGGNQSTSLFCSLPPLQPGASETATMSLLANAVGDYQIPFGVSAAEPEPGSSGVIDLGDSLTLSVSAQPGQTDIQVTGSSNNGSPPVGGTFNYAFQVKDNGPLPASGVTFDDQLPLSILVGTNITVDNGSCAVDPISNGVHCEIGTLGVGQQANISIPATPSEAGVFANTANVRMTASDAHPTNNSFTVTVQPK